MKSILALAAIMLVVLSVCMHPAFAQGDAPDCTFCRHLSDAQCENVSCTSGFGCVNQTFTVPCEAYYEFTAFMYCTNPGDCKYCRACATIYLGADPLRSCHSSCHLDLCYPSIACQTVYLKPGYTYTLVICKVPCDELPLTCDDCPESCEARTEVKYPGSTCPGW